MSEPDTVVIAGDWHGNIGWAVNVLDEADDLLPVEGRRIVLHAGDFGVWPGGEAYLDAVDRALDLHQMELWFVDGNHEDFTQLRRERPENRKPMRLRRNIWHLPRGYRWSWHGHTWLALGGAVSVDREGRTEGTSWWPEEELTEADIKAAIECGPADVMLTHDAPSRVPLALPSPPAWWNRRDLNAAQDHRALLQQVVDQVRPAHLIHGHYHLAHRTEVAMPYGRCRVTGLNCDGESGNFGSYDVRKLAWVDMI